MIICYVNDEMGVNGKTQGEEFLEFREDLLREMRQLGIDDKGILIENKTSLHEVSSFDIMILDYGGISTMSDTLMDDQVRKFVSLINECPSRIFILKSFTMTADVRYELQQTAGININDCLNLSVAPKWLPDVITHYLLNGELDRPHVY